MLDGEMELKNKEEKENTREGVRIYEVGYLLLPTIPEENVAITYGNLKELVNSLGGEIISDDMPKLRELAYSMEKVISNVRNKFNTAYFGWVKFYLDPEKLAELKKKLDLTPEVLRFLIIKTVKENTIASRRFVSREGGVRRRTYTKPALGEEPAAPINKEELDKEIEAMVAN